MDEQQMRRIESTLDQLTSPIYRWRMARGLIRPGKPLTGMNLSAHTRRENALEEADKVLRAYQPPGPTGLVEPTRELAGRVAVVHFESDPSRRYIAEVRSDFGGPAWAGSWHGFTLSKGTPIYVEWWVS